MVVLQFDVRYVFDRRPDQMVHIGARQSPVLQHRYSAVLLHNKVNKQSTIAKQSVHTRTQTA